MIIKWKETEQTEHWSYAEVDFIVDNGEGGRFAKRQLAGVEVEEIHLSSSGSGGFYAYEVWVDGECHEARYGSEGHVLLKQSGLKLTEPSDIGKFSNDELEADLNWATSKLYALGDGVDISTLFGNSYDDDYDFAMSVIAEGRRRGMWHTKLVGNQLCVYAGAGE